MNYDQATYQLIEAYLEGLLPEAERLAFEQRLLKEPGLQEAVDLEADVHRAIQYHGRRELKDRLRQIDAAVPSPKARPRHFTWWKLVASIFLLLTPLFLWWSLDWNDSPNQLYKEALAEYIPDFERGSGSEGDSLLVSSQQAWAGEDYETAGKTFDRYASAATLDAALNEYRALIALQQKEYAAAEAQLRSALDLEPDRQSSRYYLALVLFKQDQPGKCKSLLQSIIPEGGSSAEKAKEFLQSLD